MIRRLRSIIHWRRFQSRVRKARAQAVRSHARRSHIDARQREIVNLALAGGRRG